MCVLLLPSYFLIRWCSVLLSLLVILSTYQLSQATHAVLLHEYYACTN
jgi:hypothetical protein